MKQTERGFLLLTSHLGDAQSKPLTVAQFRTLANRVQMMEKPKDERELNMSDMAYLGYDGETAENILYLLSRQEQLDYYIMQGKRKGCYPIARNSTFYPATLHHRLGLDAPGCLWAKGDSRLLEYPAVALVGSRDLHPENEDFAYMVGYQAAQQGYVLVSGNAAAANLEGFLYASLNSFHQTAVNFVGQNVGARQYRRANNTVWICQSCVLVVGLVMGTAIWAFGEPLLGIYISDSSEAIQYGMVRFVYVTLPYFMLGLLDVSTGALRGYGQSLTPMIISVLGICGIRILWIFTVFQLPAFHNPKWLYLSYPISWVVTLTVQTIFFLRIRGKYLHKDQSAA